MVVELGPGEQLVQIGDIELCYETFGDRECPPLLLVMGLASQMIIWEDEFCEALAGRGFRVIRFDNRDVGRSTILRDRGIPTRTQLMLRSRRAASYSLKDMADDAAGLLDQLEVDTAHVVGASMGGMIAQLLAIRHPDRVRSLVSIMSTTGNWRVGQPSPRVVPYLLRAAPRDRETYADYFLAMYRVIGSRRYLPDPELVRALAKRCFDRGIHPSGAGRQLAAIIAAEDRTRQLRKLDLPVTVIHGDADPLIRPSGGRATAAAIPGSRLVMIPGMGHDLPRSLWGQILDEIEQTTARAVHP
jgi:pimeloyl-ACP methyl ester carboxylesterase